MIRTGHFEADGDAVNLNLGFIPAYIKIINQSAATGEIAVVEWFKDMGDSKQFETTIIADNGSTADTNFAYSSSGGVITEYDTTAVDSGTENDDDDPVRVTGGQGVTIAAAFMDDSDEIWYLAFGPNDTRDVDHGDINA